MSRCLGKSVLNMHRLWPHTQPEPWCTLAQSFLGKSGLLYPVQQIWERGGSGRCAFGLRQHVVFDRTICSQVLFLPPTLLPLFLPTPHCQGPASDPQPANNGCKQEVSSQRV